MLYEDFERVFEARLQTRADAYVNAVEYHRVQFGQLIEHLLRSILEQTDHLIKQSDADWARTIGVNLAIFHDIFSRCRPYGAQELEQTRFYTDAEEIPKQINPTGLKRVSGASKVYG